VLDDEPIIKKEVAINNRLLKRPRTCTLINNLFTGKQEEEEERSRRRKKERFNRAYSPTQTKPAYLHLPTNPRRNVPLL